MVVGLAATGGAPAALPKGVGRAAVECVVGVDGTLPGGVHLVIVLVMVMQVVMVVVELLLLLPVLCHEKGDLRGRELIPVAVHEPGEQVQVPVKTYKDNGLD